MKLERNSGDGKGKYAVVRLKAVEALFLDERVEAQKALDLLEGLGVLAYGRPNSPDEFFVIMLKDKYAKAALTAYQGAAWQDDREYAAEVTQLAMRAGSNSPYCKTPD